MALGSGIWSKSHRVSLWSFRPQARAFHTPRTITDIYCSRFKAAVESHFLCEDCNDFQRSQVGRAQQASTFPVSVTKCKASSTGGHLYRVTTLQYWESPHTVPSETKGVTSHGGATAIEPLKIKMKLTSQGHWSHFIIGAATWISGHKKLFSKFGIFCMQ